MLEIDFSEPLWLINYYHFIGALSIILNSFGLYLLACHVERLGVFRYYLMAFLLSCTAIDFQVTYLCQFIPLHPVIAGYTLGLLSKYLGVRPHTLLNITNNAVIIQLEILFLCFYKKHRSITEVLKIHVIPKLVRWLMYLGFFIAPSSGIFWFSTLALPENDKENYILEVAPELLSNFTALPNFDVYLKTPSFIIYFITIISCGTIVNIAFLLITFDILWLMKLLKLKISPRSYQKHKDAVISILVQFGTSIMCFIPPCFIAAVVVMDEDGQFEIEVTTAWFASHSSINMISLLIFFPPFRDFALMCFVRPKVSKSTPAMVSLF